MNARGSPVARPVPGDPSWWGMGSCDAGPDEHGFNFTTSRRLARRYAGPSGRVVVAYLRGLRPCEASCREWGEGTCPSPLDARRAGHDGYRIRSQEGGNTWIAFDPGNIKVAAEEPPRR